MARAEGGRDEEALGEGGREKNENVGRERTELVRRETGSEEGREGGREGGLVYLMLEEVIHVFRSTPGKKGVVKAAIRGVHTQGRGGVERMLLVGIKTVHIRVAGVGGTAEERKGFRGKKEN